MTSTQVGIKVSSEEIRNIFDRLEKAQQEIYNCYMELRALGVVVIEEKPASGN